MNTETACLLVGSNGNITISRVRVRLSSPAPSKPGISSSPPPQDVHGFPDGILLFRFGMFTLCVHTPDNMFTKIVFVRSRRFMLSGCPERLLVASRRTNARDVCFGPFFPGGNCLPHPPHACGCRNLVNITRPGVEGAGPTGKHCFAAKPKGQRRETGRATAFAVQISVVSIHVVFALMAAHLLLTRLYDNCG